MLYYTADTFDQRFPLSLEAGRALLDFLSREGTRTLNMKVAELTTGLMNVNKIWTSYLILVFYSVPPWDDSADVWIC